MPISSPSSNCDLASWRRRALVICLVSIAWAVNHEGTLWAQQRSQDSKYIRTPSKPFDDSTPRRGALVRDVPSDGFATNSEARTSAYNELRPTSDDSNRDSAFRALGAQIDQLESQFGLLRRIYELVNPTVVHIETTKEPGLEEPFRGESEAKPVEEAGAGVVVAIRGEKFVVTNRHVVYPARQQAIKIQFHDGVIVRPTQVWTDPNTDIAVMAFAREEIPAARLANSSLVGIGDFSLAIGSPFGLARSLSYGIISAKGRRNLDLGNRSIEIQDFFQTDAAINPGNSGGPLINLRGEVIGINTAIASNSGGNEGIGFSIPINLVMAVAERLTTRGELKRAYLGIRMDNDFNPAKARSLGLSAPRGALVKAVNMQSPAELAGIQVGDVILELDEEVVDDDGHLVQLVGLRQAGATVAATVLRGGRKIRLLVHLSELPSSIH